MDVRMKKVFLYVSIGIILLAIPLTVFLVGKNQEVRKKAAPASTLSFVPASQSVRVGQNFSLSVKLDTGTNQVGLVQLRIVYDPAFLEAVDITNDTFAPSIRVSKKVDPNGKISISVGAKDTAHPLLGTGNIAIVTFKAIKASATPLLVKFTPSPDTVANALNESSEDVLIGRSPASITISNADGSAATTTLNTAVIPTASITPTPTLSALSGLPLNSEDTKAATRSSEATESAVIITSIENNETVQTQQPVISGKGIPGSTVTLIIHSETGITTTVVVDENGNWTYTPTVPLDDGEHTVEAMVTDPNTGTQSTTTTEFIVASGNEIAGQASGSAIPVTGATSTTLLLIGLAILFLVSGFAIPAFIH